MRIAARNIAIAALLSTGCGGYVVIGPPPPTAVVVTRTPRGYEVDVAFFYDRLAPYGDWVRHGRYGWVWIPSGVPIGWRPYTWGHWEYTYDDEWLWVSDWEWGWAPFHYGRWYVDDGLGWVWVPGRVWAPAWVAWRRGGGHVGWAPLTPAFRWDVTVGYTWFDATHLHPPMWVFVEEQHLVRSRLRDHIAQRTRHAMLMERTRHVQDVVNRRGRPVDRSIRPADVESAVGRRIERVRVRSAESPSEPQVRRRTPGERIVFRPTIRDTPPDRAPPATEALDRRHRIETEALAERHRLLIRGFEERERRASRSTDPGTRRRFTDERREIDRQITRERRVLSERQARERRKVVRRPPGA